MIGGFSPIISRPFWRAFLVILADACLNVKESTFFCQRIRRIARISLNLYDSAYREESKRGAGSARETSLLQISDIQLVYQFPSLVR